MIEGRFILDKELEIGKLRERIKIQNVIGYF